MKQNNQQLPKGWRVCKLKDAGKIVSGGTPSTTIDEFWNGEISWITPADLSGYRDVYINKGRKSISKIGLEKSSAKLLPIGSILYSSRAPIGYVVIAGQELATNQGFKNIVPNDDVNSKYLYYYLKSIKQIVVDNANGTTFKEISASKFSELPLILPPTSEQQKIVSKIEELFSELDKGIESLKKAQEQLKVYRQAVLKWAFEGRLTNENVKDGELPEGWKWVKLGEVGKLFCGQSPSVSEVNREGKGILYVTGPEQWNGKHIEENKWTEFPKRVVPEGTIFITVKGAGVGKLFPGTNCAIGRDVYAFYPSTDLSFKFSYYALKHNIDLVIRKAQGDIPGLAKNHILDHYIGICSIKEQNIIIQEIESRLSVCEKIEETITVSLQQSEALRQSILKKAFEGKLVKEEIEAPVQNEINYFNKVQLLALLISFSEQHNIKHGEMTAAKYIYLLHTVFRINTCFKFKRWHLGPYALEMKKVVNNKKFFDLKSDRITIKDPKVLSYTYPHQSELEKGLNELLEIFSKYAPKERSHKTELLATVCKVIEDIKNTDLKAVRKSMQEWKVELKTTSFKNKAEKFSEEETKGCLRFLEEKGWVSLLIN